MRVSVIGGGISGLAVALFLARRGHSVDLFEQEPRQAGGDLDEDFFRWHRPRVPQAVQPHLLLSPARTVLLAEVPDVYEDLLRRGAQEYHEFDCFPQRPPHRDGDELLIALRARRIVVETALAAAVRDEPAVTLRSGDAVRALLIEGGSPPRVTGVATSTESCRADLVVDASGRRSPTSSWLIAAGCRPPQEERHRTGLAYLCRWYRFRDTGTQPRGRTVAGSRHALAGVFPSDNGTFALNFVLSTADPTRAALTVPQVFETAAGLFPVTAAWLRLDPEPLSSVLPMAGLDNRWRVLVDDQGPVATGMLNIGDSLIHTNPTLSQGIALGLLTAQHVAAHAEQAAADPTGYHFWAATTLRPWFDAQVAADQRRERHLAGGPAQLPRAVAMAACAADDPIVMRAHAQVRHLLRPADEAYGTREVRDRLAAWLAAHPGFDPRTEGPGRDEWLALTAPALTTPRLNSLPNSS